MRLVNKPVLCNYYLTYRCNASCHFCDIWEKPSPYVGIKEVEENLHALKRLDVKVIDFTGGEPLLHRQLPDFLTMAKNMGFITTVTTNCLLYPKFAAYLRGKIDMLHFSLDYADAALHDQSRGVACFEFVMQSIELAKALGERPDILFTVMPDNLSHIERVYQEISLPNKLVLILNPVFEYNQVAQEQKLNIQQLQYLREWGKQKLVYLNDAFIQLRLDGGNQIANPVCKAGSSTIVISPENKLMVPCYHLGLKEFTIDGKLEQVYKDKEVQQLIALEGRMPACQSCTINCYMQPSFAVEVNRYFWKALPSTLKYNRIKGTWKNLI
jgi:MoaA/NifB/PqqE/SkfB family radical SAM enzyme